MQPKTDININNELARFLGGGPSPVAEDWLGECDEHLDDLLNIAAAIEAQHEAVRSRSLARRRIALSSAAAVALLVVFSVVLFSRGTATVQTEQSPSYAAADTVASSAQADTLSIHDTL